MAILVQAGSRNYPAQDQTFDAPAPLDPSVGRLRITLTRESWPLPGQPLATISVEYSLDNGATWWIAAGSTYDGGDVLDRNGVPYVAAVLEGTVPNIGQSGRLVRGHVVSLATLRTAITVEAL